MNNKVINQSYKGPSKEVLETEKFIGKKNSVKVLEKNIDVKLIFWTDFEKFRETAPRIAFATWEHRDPKKLSYSEEEKDLAVKKILNREVIPSTQETLQFTFEISGITYIEVCRLIRRRSFSFQARCTGDSRFWDNDIIIPSNIKGTKYEKEYIDLCQKQVDLTREMVRDGISCMDARYISPKSLSQTYYFTSKWNDLITFIDSYTDMYVNDSIDSIIGFKVVQEIVSKIPEIKKYYQFNLQKIPKVAIHMHKSKECSDLFIPEKWFEKEFEWKEEDFLYKRRRTDCNSGKVYFEELEKTKELLK